MIRCSANCSFTGITHISEKFSKLQFHGHHSYFRKDFQIAVSRTSLIFRKDFQIAVSRTSLIFQRKNSKLQFHGHHSYFRKDFQIAVSWTSLIFQNRFPNCSFTDITHISEKNQNCSFTDITHISEKIFILQFQGHHSYFRKDFQLAVSRTSLIF